MYMLSVCSDLATGDRDGDLAYGHLLEDSMDSALQQNMQVCALVRSRRLGGENVAFR